VWKTKMTFVLFTCGLFIDAVSSSDYIVSNGRVI
jgi:hypothetical protein